MGKSARYLALVYLGRDRAEYAVSRLARNAWVPGEIRWRNIEGEMLQESLRGIEIMTGLRSISHLVIILSRSYYEFQKGVYPAGVEANLENILEYDRDDHVAQENGGVVSFYGEPAHIEDRIHVPFYSIGEEFLNSIKTALEADQYRSFSLLPESVLMGRNFLDSVGIEDGQGSLHLARMSAGGGLDVHHLYDSRVIESFSIKPGGAKTAIFARKLALEDEERDRKVHVLQNSRECILWDQVRGDFPGLDLEAHNLERPLMHYYLENIASLETVEGFTGQARIMPRKIPAVAYAALALVVAYAALVGFRFETLDDTTAEVARLQARAEALEREWTPLKLAAQGLEESRRLVKIVNEYQSESVSLLDLLLLLTRATPGNTWINLVQIEGSRLTIQGESDSAMSYQALLSDVKSFREVQFASSIRTNQATGKDRFMITATIDPHAVKAEAEAMIEAGDAGGGQ